MISTISRRLNANPFFLKLCPRILFALEDTRLIPGMYIPLDLWKLAEQDETLVGARGGRAITYKNMGRYLDNSEFATLVAKAWVGTTVTQSAMLHEIIKAVTASGKTVALAVKKDDPKPSDTPPSCVDVLGTEDGEESTTEQVHLHLIY